jgi:hypothetical protein
VVSVESLLEDPSLDELPDAPPSFEELPPCVGELPAVVVVVVVVFFVGRVVVVVPAAVVVVVR